LARGLGRDLAALDCIEGVALVSCIGSGLEDNPEVVARACECLHAVAVSIRELHTDTHSLAFVVSSEQRTSAVRALHDVFLARSCPPA
jgi:aspartokinase